MPSHQPTWVHHVSYVFMGVETLVRRTRRTQHVASYRRLSAAAPLHLYPSIFAHRCDVLRISVALPHSC